MVLGLNSQNKVVQQSSYYASSQSTDMQDIQSEISQKNKNQQSKESGSTKEVNKKRANSYISGITSSPTGSSFSGDITNTEQQETVESMGDISERINAAANALASISQIDTISKEVNKAKTLTTTSVESIKENTTKEIKDISEETTKSSSIHDKIYKEKESKPRLIVGSSDINYEKDKGGNYRMVLIYDSDNNIRFFKDDNPVIVIKNNAVKNIGGFFKLCSEIEKECEKKINEGEKYYYEDFLKDHGFIEKEKKVDLNKLMEEVESLCNEVTKKLEF